MNNHIIMVSNTWSPALTPIKQRAMSTTFGHFGPWLPFLHKIPYILID